MNKYYRYCLNPRCMTGHGENTTPTIITPQSAVYKPDGGKNNVVIHAPKTFRKGWNKKFYYKEIDRHSAEKFNVDTLKPLCPICNTPVDIEKETFRVAIIGPTSCGKTVYLTAINYLMTNRNDDLPMYFEQTGGDRTFVFERDNNSFYFPEATSTDERTYKYMLYDGISVAAGGSIFDKNRLKSKKKAVKLAFYDFSGEYFQNGDLEKGKDYYKLTSQLYIADMILVVIDCATITGAYKRDDFSFRQFLEKQLVPLKKRNPKDFCVAICYLASDVLDDDLYGLKSSYPLKFNEDMYNSYGFKYENCKKHIMTVDRAFVHNSRYSNEVIGDLIEKRMFVPGETLGLFAISSVGSQKIQKQINKSNSNYGRFYIDDYNVMESWNVMAPILWFLNRKGYVDTTS